MAGERSILHLHSACLHCTLPATCRHGDDDRLEEKAGAGGGDTGETGASRMPPTSLPSYLEACRSPLPPCVSHLFLETVSGVEMRQGRRGQGGWQCGEAGELLALALGGPGGRGWEWSGSAAGVHAAQPAEECLTCPPAFSFSKACPNTLLLF